MMRRKSSVHLMMISWSVLSFLASSLATFSKASFVLSKAHSVTFTSFLKVFFCILPTLHFATKTEACLTILCVQSVSLQHFTLLQVLSGWRFLVPLAQCSCLPFFFQLPLEIFLLLIFLGRNSPTFLACTALFPSFSTAFHDAPISPQTHTTATLSMVCLLLPPGTCCNIACITWSCMIPHRPSSPPTQTARR